MKSVVFLSTQKGKIEGVGKKVNKNENSNDYEIIDAQKKILVPGIIDMKVFVGEPGFEYKENFRTLSQAAFAGGVTSVVSMPNTKPIIDNVSMVDLSLEGEEIKAK